MTGQDAAAPRTGGTAARPVLLDMAAGLPARAGAQPRVARVERLPLAGKAVSVVWQPVERAAWAEPPARRRRLRAAATGARAVQRAPAVRLT